MTQEEKAKAYDGVREKIALRFGSNVAEEVFSEFEISDDERIRKELLQIVKDSEDSFYMVMTPQKRKAIIAWLEKQGKQEIKEKPIWKHWKDGIAGNGEGKQIFLIKSGDSYTLSSCLGYECDYIELSELDKLLLQEKQGEKKSIDWDKQIKYNPNAPSIIEEKSAWSEADNLMLAKVINFIPHHMTAQSYNEFFNWLKSLRNRIKGE